MPAPSGNSIVVGLDGSECSGQALRWAIDEARMTGRELSIVHVWDWFSDVQLLPMGSGPTLDAHRMGRALLDRAAAEAKRQDVAVRTHLRRGSPSEELTNLAAKAAMLVVGSHGRRPLSSALLGSVSKGCVRHASCPVVVIPHVQEAPESESATADLASRR